MPSSKTPNPYTAVLRDLMRDRRRIRRWLVSRPPMSRAEQEEMQRAAAYMDERLAQLVRRLDNPYVWEYTTSNERSEE